MRVEINTSGKGCRERIKKPVKKNAMFTKMKNIDSAFRYVRGFTLVIVTGCILLSGFVIYESYLIVSRSKNKIYVLANGKVLEAMESERKNNLPVEARDHIKTFHELFFTLDPDDQVIQAHITKALYLADASAKREYQDLKEKGFYANLIAGNISQRIKVDSLKIDTDRYPYYFKCYATQRIIRTTRTALRSLVTEGYLRNVSRSDHNPHGFLIERWRILENRNLKTKTK